MITIFPNTISLNSLSVFVLFCTTHMYACHYPQTRISSETEASPKISAFLMAVTHCLYVYMKYTLFVV